MCGLTGRELEENEAVREELRNLHQQVQQYERMQRVFSLDTDRAMKAALQKVQLMEKIKDEVVKQVPSALMGYLLHSGSLYGKDRSQGDRI